ncbi:hypothetical protein JZ751_019010 [Albula glossodonta]|uniref:Bromodomain protein 4 C-terminal domain-containing protein n=1 Tax=Albula glossodonta TaxID=121402 RepID=A0A8T2NMB1_9TELE|nr:hypothetical protein JZ751_019010 [Albula glossodonta]
MLNVDFASKHSESRCFSNSHCNFVLQIEVKRSQLYLCFAEQKTKRKLSKGASDCKIKMKEVKRTTSGRTSSVKALDETVSQTGLQPTAPNSDLPELDKAQQSTKAQSPPKDMQLSPENIVLSPPALHSRLPPQPSRPSSKAAPLPRKNRAASLQLDSPPSLPPQEPQATATPLPLPVSTSVPSPTPGETTPTPDPVTQPPPTSSPQPSAPSLISTTPPPPPQQAQTQEAQSEPRPLSPVNQPSENPPSRVQPEGVSALLSPLSSPPAVLFSNSGATLPGLPHPAGGRMECLLLSPLQESPVQSVKDETKPSVSQGEPAPKILQNSHSTSQSEGGENDSCETAHISAANKVSKDTKPSVPKTDIVLKNADSWASLGKMATVAPSTIKSSKESFQQFRRVAMEKEERERALRKLQMEVGREKRPVPEKPREEHEAVEPTQTSSPAAEAPRPAEPAKAEPASPPAAQPPQLTAQSSVDRDREMARKREQERRRREAMSAIIDMTMQSDIMATFEKNLD